MTARLAVAAALATGAALLAGCGSPAAGAGAGGRVAVVAGEIQYGDVVAQIGGPYVSVYSVDSNPNTDPHTYEATPSVARKVAEAQLLVENGVGYDGFMTKLASASPSSRRRVVDVQKVLGLPDTTPNPHLWYDTAAMPAVARALADQLAAIAPARAATFRANEAAFDASLQPLRAAIAVFKAAHHGTRAATTEPVADYLLAAMGIDDLTPFRLQADIMNGTDPTPQDVVLLDGLLARRRVAVFCYNRQVTDSLTTSIRQAAVRAGIPVVAVYETMPTPGYHYQSWMMRQVAAIRAAVTSGTSTGRL